MVASPERDDGYSGEDIAMEIEKIEAYANSAAQGAGQEAVEQVDSELDLMRRDRAAEFLNKAVVEDYLMNTHRE